MKLRISPETKLTLQLAAEAANQTLGAFVTALVYRATDKGSSAPDCQLTAVRDEVRAAQAEIEAAMKRCNSHGGLVKQLWDAIDRRDLMWGERMRNQTLETIDEFRLAATALGRLAGEIAKRIPDDR